MEKIGKISILISIVICFFLSEVKGQEKVLGKGRYQHTVSDSLITEFYNKIYGSFYSRSYRTNAPTTFTIIKIAIDEKGKIKSINFSDSADSAFVSAFNKRKDSGNDNLTLERYAKVKSYTNTNLLIPVIFEPDYPNQRKLFTYDEMESLLKFNKKNFVDVAIFLKPVYIRVSNKNTLW